MEALAEICVRTFLTNLCSHMSLASCSVPPQVLFQNYVCIYAHTYIGAVPKCVQRFHCSSSNFSLPWINAWYLSYQRCVDEVNWSWFQASKHPGPQPQQKDHLCPCPAGVPKELVAHWLLGNVESHSSLELLKVVKLCMSTLVVSRSPPRCLPARLHI